VAEASVATAPPPEPRLRARFRDQIRADFMKAHAVDNLNAAPALRKIVLNMGVGAARENKALADAAQADLTLIAGQKAALRKARKAVSNFHLREGMPIGCVVTLRGARMWEFLDRFISTAVPRVRDFRGLSTRSFDGRGNYSLGVKEQMIFPEINYDMIDQIHGMDVTFVTTTDRDDQAYALLRELGMPFRGDDKPIVVNA
jgi:large subunit ribosomal protein L5